MKTNRELFLYELEGRGYTFENMTWLGDCFEDNFLNMAYEMWCASASREGYKFVPVEPSSETLKLMKDAYEEHLSEGMSDAYKSMIEAA